MKTQDFTAAEFIGHWCVRWPVIRFDWILRSDSTFTGKMSVFGIPVLRLTGTWSINGDKLVSIYDKLNLVASGHKDMDTLLEVADDYFVLVTRGGTRRRWERVYESPAA